MAPQIRSLREYWVPSDNSTVLDRLSL